MSTAAPITALFVVLFSLGLKGQDCPRNCLTTAVQGRLKCLFSCRIQNEGSFGQIPRSTNEGIDIEKQLQIERAKRSNDCYESNKLKNERNGIKNPKAKIRQIIYSLHKNKTIARVIWDPPAECVERGDMCKGYFVKWKFSYLGVLQRTRCQIINNKSINYIILDGSTGFDAKKDFDVAVRAFPYKSKWWTSFSFMVTQIPESSDKPIIVNFTTKPKRKPTPSPTPATTTSSSTKLMQTKLPTEPSDGPSSTNAVKDGDRAEKQTPTTLIFSLSIFTVVTIGAVVLVAKWWYKTKPNLKIFKIDYDENQVIKGEIYISYLPEKATMNKIGDLYSWLKSHSIDVVMDQMFPDHKLYNSLGPIRFGERFVARADKVIMIVTPGYLKLCWLDDTVDIKSTPNFNSLDEQRLFSEVTYIKNELSITLKHARTRFIPVLINVSDDHLPKWLQKLTRVKWPDDGKNKTFLNLLKGDDMPANIKSGDFLPRRFCNENVDRSY